jgi:hypothetical protein
MTVEHLETFLMQALMQAVKEKITIVAGILGKVGYLCLMEKRGGEEGGAKRRHL